MVIFLIQNEILPENTSSETDELCPLMQGLKKINRTSKILITDYPGEPLE
jgi:hypothetical protein